MYIPKELNVKLNQAERFCIGLRELLNECELESLSYNAFGILQYHFKDGTKVGSKYAHEQATGMDLTSEYHK